jgi:hypothetical protein
MARRNHLWLHHQLPQHQLRPLRPLRLLHQQARLNRQTSSRHQSFQSFLLHHPHLHRRKVNLQEVFRLHLAT